MPTYLAPGVFVEEVDSGSRPIEGVGTAVAAFIGLAETGPFNTPTLVSNWTQYTTTFGSFVEGVYLAQSVYAYFQNGGGNCYIVRIGESSQNGNGRTSKAIAATPQGTLGGLKITSIDASIPEGQLTVEVQQAEEGSPEGSFKLLVKRGEEVLEDHDRLNTGRGRQNVATAVNAASKLINIEDTRGTIEVPPAGTSTGLHLPPPAAAVPSPSLSSDDYVGDVAERSGFSGLEAVDEVDDDLRSRSDERVPAGRHRPGDGAGRAAGDDRALRADG